MWCGRYSSWLGSNLVGQRTPRHGRVAQVDRGRRPVSTRESVAANGDDRAATPDSVRRWLSDRARCVPSKRGAESPVGDVFRGPRTRARALGRPRVVQLWRASLATYATLAQSRSPWPSRSGIRIKARRCRRRPVLGRSAAAPNRSRSGRCSRWARWRRSRSGSRR